MHKKHIHTDTGRFVGMIVLQSKLADSYNAQCPWLLLHNTGKTDSFSTQLEVEIAAKNLWPRCTLLPSAY